MKRNLSIPALALFAFFMVGPAVSADLFKTQTSPSQREAPERMIEEGMKMILGAIQLIIESIPEYKAPEVLENGDIIIRRVRPSEKSSHSEDKSKKGI